MKRLALSVVMVLASLPCAFGQNPPGAEELAESLRGQLRDVIAKESELQIRMQQIEEDSKPENIQRSIALIGSLRPEELREQRRQQLEKDKANVSAQLDALANSRTRLEASIARAEAEADRERTRVENPTPPTPPVNPSTTSTNTTNVVTTPTTVRRPRRTARRSKTRPRRQRTRRQARP